jgi:hypothetical protein
LEGTNTMRPVSATNPATSGEDDTRQPQCSACDRLLLLIADKDAVIERLRHDLELSGRAVERALRVLHSPGVERVADEPR